MSSMWSIYRNVIYFLFQKKEYFYHLSTQIYTFFSLNYEQYMCFELRLAHVCSDLSVPYYVDKVI